MNLSLLERDTIVRIILASAREQIEEIYIFGSFASGREVRSSDLDIMVRASQKLSATSFVTMAQQFEDSDIAYIVDLVDFHSIDNHVQDAMLKDAVTIYRQNLLR